jgi:hypothetical protein
MEEVIVTVLNVERINMTNTKHDAVGETLNQFYLGRINIYEAKRELLELVRGCVPLNIMHSVCHDGICHLHETDEDKAHNACRAETLANISKLFGEGE